MKKLFQTTLLGMALWMGPMSAQAQMQVDIGLYESEKGLEVRLRPTESFTGVVSAVVFTIRWENNGGGALSELEQKRAPQMYLPTTRSGPVTQDGPYSYQIYAGFGMDLMEDLDFAWEAGKEYTIANIPVAPGARYELVNDDWTRENNGDYYLSLGGEDRTGEIYKKSVGTGSQVPFSITPNPSNGQFTVVIPVNRGEATAYEIVNGAGQVVAKRQVETDDGVYQEDMDLTRFGAGTYHMRIFRNGRTETHKIVFH